MDGLKNLKAGNGEEYTLVRTGGMGFVFSVSFRLLEVRVQPYAQYPESVLLVVLPKGKRKITGYRFVPRDTYAIWEGIVKPDTEMFVESEVLPSGTTVRKSLGSCDPEYMRKAIASVDKEPIVKNFEMEA